jgi:hypothetical protein
MSLATALPKLIADLEQIQVDMSTEADPAAARKAVATRQGQAIYQFVLQGLVNTAGTAAAQVGKMT